MDIIEVFKWLEGHGLFYGILLFWVIAFIIKPDLGKRIGLIFVGLFTVFKWARKTNVSRSFELQISSVSNEMNKQMGKEILPSNPKIKWANNTTREAFLKNNEVVVKLDYHDDRNRTFAIAASNYVSKGLLPIARQYIPDEVMKTCSLLVTRRIISDKNKESLEYFVSEILKEVFSDKPDLEKLYWELTDLDNNAMFLQILIPELWKMGKRIYPNNVKSSIVSEEIEKLIKFLHKIATKKFDENAKLNLDSNLFKIRVILVGRIATLQDRGVDPYISRVNQGINRGYQGIYLLGYERKAKYLDQLKKRFENHLKIDNIKITEGEVLDKSFDNMKCICVSLSIKENITETEEVS